MTREDADAALEQIVRFLDLLNVDPPTPPRLEATDGIRGNPEREIHVRTAPEETPSGPEFDKAVAALAQIEELAATSAFDLLPAFSSRSLSGTERCRNRQR